MRGMMMMMRCASLSDSLLRFFLKVSVFVFFFRTADKTPKTSKTSERREEQTHHHQRGVWHFVAGDTVIYKKGPPFSFWDLHHALHNTKRQGGEEMLGAGRQGQPPHSAPRVLLSARF